MNDRQNQEHKRIIADKFQEGSACLYKIFGPEWNARSEALKTLASVSSGAAP